MEDIDVFKKHPFTMDIEKEIQLKKKYHNALYEVRNKLKESLTLTEKMDSIIALREAQENLVQ
jgi:hypothetical protein